jgi:hypothetical protein
MIFDNIITSDKFIDISHNIISRQKTFINHSPKKNIFFVKTDFLDFFVWNILPQISYPFYIITHESDHEVPGKYERLLEHPLLVKWFGMNVQILHEKLQPIPIGLACSLWPHGDIKTLLKVIKQKNAKENLIYCNYKTETNITEREKALQCLQNKSFITFDFNHHTFEEYLIILSKYKYVVSPPGNSIDCHRIWESIYLDTVPICLKSVAMVYFRDCPILFINDWNDITEQLLNEKYSSLVSRNKEKSDFIFYKKLLST